LDAHLCWHVSVPESCFCGCPSLLAGYLHSLRSSKCQPVELSDMIPTPGCLLPPLPGPKLPSMPDLVLTLCTPKTVVYCLFIDYLLPPLPKLPRMPDLVLTLCTRQHIHIVHRRERDTTPRNTTALHEQEALQVSLFLCALCALPLACPRQQHEALVPDLVLEYRTPTCALPLAYAGPPTQLCTVTCFCSSRSSVAVSL